MQREITPTLKSSSSSDNADLHFLLIPSFSTSFLQHVKGFTLKKFSSNNPSECPHEIYDKTELTPHCYLIICRTCQESIQHPVREGAILESGMSPTFPTSYSLRAILVDTANKEVDGYDSRWLIGPTRLREAAIISRTGHLNSKACKKPNTRIPLSKWWVGLPKKPQTWGGTVFAESLYSPLVSLRRAPQI
jgi:hypothetical protein